MQENSNQTPVIKTSLFSWYASLALFVGILAGIIGMYLYGTFIDSRIVARQGEIIQVEKQIAEIGQDKKMLITQIISSNAIRPSLDLKNIVMQFRMAAAKAEVGFQGFSIKNDTIATTLIATAGINQIHPDPVATIITMMRTYANDAKLYFSLDPIMSVSGDLSKRTTGITLHVTQAIKQ